MEKPVQGMTLTELRDADELERTRADWETMDVDYVLAHGQLPVLNRAAHRHQEIVDELFQRLSNS
jgi:phospholipid N-methyltransferase